MIHEPPRCVCGEVAALALQVKSPTGRPVGPRFVVCANGPCTYRHKADRSIGGLAAAGRTVERTPLAAAAALPIPELFELKATG